MSSKTSEPFMSEFRLTHKHANADASRHLPLPEKPANVPILYSSRNLLLTEMLRSVQVKLPNAVNLG